MYLTKRQKEIYQYLKEHIQTMGYAPSIMEICMYGAVIAVCPVESLAKFDLETTFLDLELRNP